MIHKNIKIHTVNKKNGLQNVHHVIGLIILGGITNWFINVEYAKLILWKIMAFMKMQIMKIDIIVLFTLEKILLLFHKQNK